jgi:hypothetical protein
LSASGRLLTAVPATPRNAHLHSSPLRCLHSLQKYH